MVIAVTVLGSAPAVSGKCDMPPLVHADTSVVGAPGFVQQPGTAFLAQSVAIAVQQPVQDRCRHYGIAEYCGMPLSLTGELLRSGSLTRIIRCMAGPFRSATAKRGTRR